MNRVVEGNYGDLPLPGPWSRRGKAPQSGGDIPAGSEAGAYGSEGIPEDLPLSGPWSQRQGDGTSPQQPTGDSAVGREGERETAGEYNSSGSATRTGQDEDRGARAPEPEGKAAVVIAEAPEGAVQYTLRLADDRRDGRPDPQPDKCSDGGGHRSDMAHRLFCPSGLYAGIIMAEVLGGRGGRPKRRESLGKYF